MLNSYNFFQLSITKPFLDNTFNNIYLPNLLIVTLQSCPICSKSNFNSWKYVPTHSIKADKLLAYTNSKSHYYLFSNTYNSNFSDGPPEPRSTISGEHISTLLQHETLAEIGQQANARKWTQPQVYFAANWNSRNGKKSWSLSFCNL